MKFTKEIKAKWLEDLRSGKFEQGSARLVTEPKHSSTGNTQYCCLGVLSAQLKGDQFYGKHVGFLYKPETTEYETKYLPSNVTNSNSAQSRCLLLSFHDQAILAEMNDKGANFYEIAEYIETHIPAEE